MSDDTTHRVNVVFVGGTVDELLPFFHSLLAHTDDQFRLVANGCNGAERATLTAEADAHGERVAYHLASRDVVRVHGAVLDQLLELEPSDHFVFIDSDILATGPTSFDTLRPTAGEGARCSALPLWHRPSERVAPTGFRILGGRFVEVDGADVVVGCSYAAGYHTDQLRRLVDDWGITLAHAHTEALPAAVRAELARRGLDFDFYDTAKVANVLLDSAGAPVSMVDLDHVVHVGALSGPHHEGAPRHPARRAAVALAGRAGPWMRTVQWRAQGLSWAESRSMGDLAARRRSACEFAKHLAAGHATLASAPNWCQDPEVFSALVALYRGHPDGAAAPGGPPC